MKTIIVSLLALGFVGCASVGTPIATQNVQNIKKGVTTEADLVRMFGPPTTKTLNANGNIVMVWTHSAAQAKGTSFIPIAGAFVGGTNVQVQQLTVLLNSSGSVQNYTMNESHPDVKMGGD
jgi:hypothetical protein